MMETSSQGLDLEKELSCSICTEVLYQPLTLLDCLHTFCGACLKEWFSYTLARTQSNSNAQSPGANPYSCPSCRAPVRGTKNSSTINTLLDMFLAANPGKGKTADDKEECRSKYTPGDDVMPKVDERAKSLRERRVDDEDRRLLAEVRDMSLRDVGVGSSSAGRNQRREETRLRPAGLPNAPRTSRSREHSRDDRATEGRDRQRRAEDEADGSRRRRRDGSAPTRSERASNESHHNRTGQGSSRNHDGAHRSVAQTIEHQPSLRSLISTSEIDSHEMEEEILRQIHEEGLLDGIDLQNIDVDEQDQISERIAQAFRRRQRQQAATRLLQTHSTEHPNATVSTTAHSSRDTPSSNTTLRPSSAYRAHARSTSATSQTDEQSRRSPRSSSSEYRTEPSLGERRRRRTTSRTRTSAPSASAATDVARSATRSQTDISDRPRSTGTRRSHTQIASAEQLVPAPLTIRTRRPETDTGDLAVNDSDAAMLRSESNSVPHAQVDTLSSDRSDTPNDELTGPVTTRTSRPAPTTVPSRSAVAATSDQDVAPDPSFVPAPLNTHRHLTLSDRAAAFTSASRPTSSSSAVSQPRSPRFPEPSITCSRCEKPHIEYELHYNCGVCSDGNWNVCLQCYRTGRGCLYWFGFGTAAWTRWELQRSNGQVSADAERPHMLTGSRYLPPQVTDGGADGRRTITSDDPQKRLQSGVFCARCLAWANECYWRCEACNDNDWGFCNSCVNQGNCCTHPLLPLSFASEDSSVETDVALSPAHEQHRPTSAAFLEGPDVQSYGRFRPLTFKTRCENCKYPISPSSSRYHCNFCTSSLVPDSRPGDYDVCFSCYNEWSRKRRISAENGAHGWRRCLEGHRMCIVGFEDSKSGQRRIIAEDLVGGRCLKTKPYIPSDANFTVPAIDRSSCDLQLWTWADGSMARIVTPGVAASAPIMIQNLSGQPLTTTFPASGGEGLRARALWAWYPVEGEGGDELLFPRGAEVREVVDVNGDWFFGVYMGEKGLFPAPYVRTV